MSAKEILDFTAKHGGSKNKYAQATLVDTLTKNVLQKMYPIVSNYISKVIKTSKHKHFKHKTRRFK